MPTTLLAVREGFITNLDGVDTTLVKGELIESDHPLVAKYPGLFEPVTLRHPVKRKVEQATAAPGEKRAR